MKNQVQGQMQETKEEQVLEEIQKQTEEAEKQSEEKGDKKKSKGLAFGIAIGLVIGIAVTIVGGIVIAKVFVSDKSSDATSVVSADTLSKLQTIHGYIDLNYYDEVDQSALEEGMLEGYVAGLGDPYAAYYSADDYKDVTINATRQYAGIGATLSQNKETMLTTITYIYEDSPAEKAGLRTGDIIAEVDGTDVTTMDVDELVDLVRGDENTTVTISVYREGEDDYLDIDVTREIINLPSVDYEMLDDGVGYIYLTKFATDTANEFEEAVADLQSQGMKALIIDVRNNGGGLLASVVRILDDILPEGTVVYTEDKYGNREDQVSSGDTQLDLPIAVLVNGYSASASEILAGAIRDFDYGTLIGTTTYGKGCVQQTFGLSDGSAIKITTEQYFTPNGENIQGVGITPDIELEYEYSGGEDEEYSWKYDNQIAKAVEVLTQQESGD